MTIVTGLSVPVFNVLKYFMVITMIETVARGALQNFYVFFRRFELYRGTASSLSTCRIDRYNLLQLARKGSCSQFVVWSLLVISLYAVEIFFEFSSDAVIQVVTHSDRKRVYSSLNARCNAEEMLEGYVVVRMGEMAQECVGLTATDYTLYKPVWTQTEQVVAEKAICVKIPQNFIARGKRIYSYERYFPGSAAWNATRGLREAVKMYAWKYDEDPYKSSAVITISWGHIKAPRTTKKGQFLVQEALILVPLNSSGTVCGGNVVGRNGEGVMRITMFACVQKVSPSWHFIKLSGTAAILQDATTMETEPWTVNILVNLEIAIPDFNVGVFDTTGELSDVNKVIAFASLLGIGNGKDPDSLNRYAVVYRHCEKLAAPGPAAKASLRKVEFVTAEQRTVASISEYGTTILILWSIIVWVTSRSLQYIGDRRRMPKDVEGEISIALRWACQEAAMLRNPTSTHEPIRSMGSKFMDWFRRRTRCQLRKKVFLNVEPGDKFDDIVASFNADEACRDLSKPFKPVC